MKSPSILYFSLTFLTYSDISESISVIRISVQQEVGRCNVSSLELKWASSTLMNKVGNYLQQQFT